VLVVVLVLDLLGFYHQKSEVGPRRPFVDTSQATGLNGSAETFRRTARIVRGGTVARAASRVRACLV
jgi:hypothetical protein